MTEGETAHTTPMMSRKKNQRRLCLTCRSIIVDCRFLISMALSIFIHYYSITTNNHRNNMYYNHKRNNKQHHCQKTTTDLFYFCDFFEAAAVRRDNNGVLFVGTRGSRRPPSVPPVPSPASKRIAKSKNIQAHLPACTNKLQLCVLLLAEYITHLNRHRVERHHV